MLSQIASAQTGLTGIFGGGPFYKNATKNITEIENSGFTEAIVWSVEVNSVGDLNFNGEFPLTSNGVYVGAQTHPDFAANKGPSRELRSASGRRTSEIGKTLRRWFRHKARAQPASFIRISPL